MKIYLCKGQCHSKIENNDFFTILAHFLVKGPKKEMKNRQLKRTCIFKYNNMK